MRTMRIATASRWQQLDDEERKKQELALAHKHLTESLYDVSVSKGAWDWEWQAADPAHVYAWFLEYHVRHGTLTQFRRALLLNTLA